METGFAQFTVTEQTFQNPIFIWLDLITWAFKSEFCGNPIDDAMATKGKEKTKTQKSIDR